MLRNTKNKGKVYGSLLPNVGIGQSILASHINRLSEAIDRNKINSFVGGNVIQNNNGTSIISESKSTSFPFKVTVLGKKVSMVIGHVHNGVTNWTTPSQFINGYESSISKLIPTSGPCNYSLLPNSTQKNNTIYFDRSQEGEGAKSKLLYVSVGFVGMSTFHYVDWDGTMEDVLNYDYRSGIPIAYISKSGAVAQIQKTDIWAVDNSHPFKIYPFYDSVEQAFYIKMNVGQVNNLFPTMDGVSITNSSAKKWLANDVENYVWLKCNGQPKPANFPSNVTVEITQTTTPPEGEAGYIMIGFVLVSNSAPSGQPPKRSAAVYQLVKNSLWTEAHKYQQDKVDYFFYHT